VPDARDMGGSGGFSRRRKSLERNIERGPMDRRPSDVDR
jgi:hypothetical protein